MSTTKTKTAEEKVSTTREPRAPDPSPTGSKWVYLRAVYPLNPGIPHYLDFPQRA